MGLQRQLVQRLAVGGYFQFRSLAVARLDIFVHHKELTLGQRQTIVHKHNHAVHALAQRIFINSYNLSIVVRIVFLIM